MKVDKANFLMDNLSQLLTSQLVFAMSVTLLPRSQSSEVSELRDTRLPFCRR